MGPNSTAKDLIDLGQYVTLLTPKQLRDLPPASVKAALQNLGSSVEWSPSQLRTLAKNQLGDKKVSLQRRRAVFFLLFFLFQPRCFSHAGPLQCGQVTAEDVMNLQSVAAGLSSCALKNIKSEKLLADPANLTNITKHMKKGQLKAMLNGVRQKQTMENKED